MHRLLQFISTRPRKPGESDAAYAVRLLAEATRISPDHTAFLAAIAARVSRSFDRVRQQVNQDMDLMLPA